MLGIPAPTPLDLHFRLLGIPIRISPFFWLLAVIIGMAFGRGGDASPQDAVIIAGCVFVSVLVHELGHGLTAKFSGDEPWIVLHGFGGFCASNREQQTFGRRLLIIVMGPVSGYLLAAVTVMVWAALVYHGVAIPAQVELGLFMLLILNVIYSTFNLLPIWPLDGGQLLMTALDRLSPRHGTRRAHILSFFASGMAAVLAAVWAQWFILTVWLGFYAFMNFVLLSHYHRIATAERDGL